VTVTWQQQQQQQAQTAGSDSEWDGHGSTCNLHASITTLAHDPLEA
jgi:hypothetical protein